MIKIIKKKRLILKLFKIIEYKKIINVDMSEDKDEYFDRYKTIIQLMTKINPKEIEKAKRTPRYTAIPFPPLNFIQMGKICPRKHKSAERYI
jgi:hypothetical protein